MARRGRITASNFYSVYTKVKTIKAKPDTPTDVLLAKITGYTRVSESILALKYGREMEDEAKNSLRIFPVSMKVHGAPTWALSYQSTWPSWVLHLMPCSAASAMRKDTAPNANILSYLYESPDGVKLKQNHVYYAQCQGQMADRVRHCSVKVNVAFDCRYWEDLRSALDYFEEHVSSCAAHSQRLRSNEPQLGSPGLAISRVLTMATKMAARLDIQELGDNLGARATGWWWWSCSSHTACQLFHEVHEDGLEDDGATGGLKKTSGFPGSKVETETDQTASPLHFDNNSFLKVLDRLEDFPIDGDRFEEVGSVEGYKCAIYISIQQTHLTKLNQPPLSQWHSPRSLGFQEAGQL
ncbi:hypothetical protein Bbelb_344200 [Branchiostoma belcheri]|nr:hypothetical protein Bbelb_344200 [Branchiostoma belcheri]